MVLTAAKDCIWHAFESMMQYAKARIDLALCLNLDIVYLMVIPYMHSRRNSRANTCTHTRLFGTVLYSDFFYYEHFSLMVYLSLGKGYHI